MESVGAPDPAGLLSKLLVNRLQPILALLSEEHVLRDEFSVLVGVYALRVW